MSIVSSVPGRIRLESGKLIGKASLCLVMEEKLNGMEGVKGADISPRTGRVLIRFDTSRTSEEILMKEVRYLLESCVDVQEALMKPRANGRDPKKMNNLVVHSIIDITGHMLMPKPFGLLLPLAIHAMRKAL